MGESGEETSETISHCCYSGNIVREIKKDKETPDSTPCPLNIGKTSAGARVNYPPGSF